MGSSSVLHSYHSILSPNQKNDIRNVNTTQHTSPNEGQALMKVRGGRGKICESSYKATNNCAPPRITPTFLNHSVQPAYKGSLNLQAPGAAKYPAFTATVSRQRDVAY